MFHRLQALSSVLIFALSVGVACETFAGSGSGSSKSTTGSSGRSILGARVSNRTLFKKIQSSTRLQRMGIKPKNLLNSRRIVNPPSRYSPGKGAELIKNAVGANGSVSQFPGLEPNGDALFTTKITYQGSRTADFDVAWSKVPGGANKTFNVQGQLLSDKELVWHHLHDYQPGLNGSYGEGSMVLMKRAVHDALTHAGGVWQATQYHGYYN